eukprot:scaffold168746_cov49-Prasinocladus_malaysianus.AAC.1
MDMNVVIQLATVVFLASGGLARGVFQQVSTLPNRRELVELDPQAKCDLCEDNWLLILGAAGRTGSTTAQAMFDSIPGFEIAGEHWGLLYEEFRIVEHIKATGNHSGVAWKHNPVDLHSIKCSIQERMKRVVLGADFESKSRSTKVIGFKEVRYQTLRMLHFISEIFPCAHFVFTYRKKPHAEVRAKWGFGKEYNHLWVHTTPMFLKVHEHFRETCSMFGVEALTTKHYNRVLHEKLGVRGCNYTHVYHHNADGGYLADDSRDALLTGECDLSGLDFRHSPEELERREGIWQQLLAEHHAAQATPSNDRDLL